MGFLVSSYLETVGVKSQGRKKIFCLLSDTLLTTFNKEFVHLNTTGIERVTSRGILTVDKTEHEFDAIVYLSPSGVSAARDVIRTRWPRARQIAIGQDALKNSTRRSGGNRRRKG